MQDLIAALRPAVKEQLLSHLATRPLVEVVALDCIQELLAALFTALGQGLAEAWADALAALAQRLAGTCPRCGRQRVCRSRASHPMRLQLLGQDVALPKLYLACEHCDAPPVSITRLLTGLSAGEASLELKLVAAYCAAEKSYRAAQTDLEVHHGQHVERAKLRRIALEVEKEAMRFAETSRRAALARLDAERRTEGPARLIVEGDGGTTRTGQLVPCVAGDAAFGRTTPKRGLSCRKRETHFREIITLDVREPGEVEASALDVLVPHTAAEGERTRRMLATAARKGLGDNTRLLGLGDMGSELAPSFAEAFHAYRGSFWLADWHHTCEYVRLAAAVLERLDVQAWKAALRTAIWQRDRAQCDRLLECARRRRVKNLPAQLEKCPVAALATYLINNWQHMRHADAAALGLPTVSARAEAQVRDRSKRRFRVPGAWRVENLEPKATLRAIIAEGRWPAFRAAQHHNARSLFAAQLRERLLLAIASGRLDAKHVASFIALDPPAQERIAA